VHGQLLLASTIGLVEVGPRFAPRQAARRAPEATLGGEALGERRGKTAALVAAEDVAQAQVREAPVDDRLDLLEPGLRPPGDRALDRR
jgi:hypothetical protein